MENWSAYGLSMYRPNRTMFHALISYGLITAKTRLRLGKKLKTRTIVACLLALTGTVLALPGAATLAHAHLCGTGNTYNTATFNPASGKYVDITAVACGSGYPNFTREHHQVECSTSSPSSDWSFGSGYYEYYAYDRTGRLVYDQLTNTNNSCPNNTTLFSVSTYTVITDFQLTVTYLPTNQSSTLFAEATDCAASSCPI
jgi:hypothetical protein